jgi:hypothetical protein
VASDTRSNGFLLLVLPPMAEEEEEEEGSRVLNFPNLLSDLLLLVLDLEEVIDEEEELDRPLRDEKEEDDDDDFLGAGLGAALTGESSTNTASMSFIKASMSSRSLMVSM